MTAETGNLAQGALMAALAAILGLISIFVPIIGAVATILWTIPLIILVFRFDLKTGGMGLLIALAIIGMVAGPIGALSLGLKNGLAGLVFGYAFKKKISPSFTVLAGGITAAIGTGIMLLLAFFVMGGTGLDFGEIEEMVDQALRFYEESGLLSTLMAEGMTGADLKKQLMQMMTLAIALIPGSMVLASLFSAGITFVLSREVLKRLGHPFTPLPPFREWQMPWWLIYGFILGLALVLAEDYLGGGFLSSVGKNIVFVYLPILLINGLAVAVHFYRRWKLTPILKGLLFFILLFNLPFVLPFFVLIGAFDPLFDYRRLKRKEKKEND